MYPSETSRWQLKQPLSGPPCSMAVLGGAERSVERVRRERLRRGRRDLRTTFSETSLGQSDHNPKWITLQRPERSQPEMDITTAALAPPGAGLEPNVLQRIFLSMLHSVRSQTCSATIRTGNDSIGYVRVAMSHNERLMSPAHQPNFPQECSENCQFYPAELLPAKSGCDSSSSKQGER